MMNKLINPILQLLRLRLRKRKNNRPYKPRPGWWYTTPKGQIIRVHLVDEDRQSVTCRPLGRQYCTRVPLVLFRTGEYFKRLGRTV